MSSEHTADGVRTDTVEPETDKIRLANLSAFQRDVLWMLASQGPLKGLAIKSELRGYYARDINHGQLYPNLDELVEHGLIYKRARDQRTNEYGLTPSGERALRKRQNWIQGTIDSS